MFRTDFGYQFKSIPYRRPDCGKYIILLANEGALYDDRFGTGDEFTYSGEGIPGKGDQSETPANKALIEAVTDPIPTYPFTSEDGIDEYEYRGLESVEDNEYVSDGKRMIYRFHMQQLRVSSWEECQEEGDEVNRLGVKPRGTRPAPPVEEKSQGEPELTEGETVFTESRARARSAVFARKLKAEYDYTYPICGARRFSPQGNPEVEAAHIP